MHNNYVHIAPTFGASITYIITTVTAFITFEITLTVWWVASTMATCTAGVRVVVASSNTRSYGSCVVNLLSVILEHTYLQLVVVHRLPELQK